jgi:hypothetical protein
MRGSQNQLVRAQTLALGSKASEGFLWCMLQLLTGRQQQDHTACLWTCQEVAPQSCKYSTVAACLCSFLLGLCSKQSCNARNQRESQYNLSA